MTGGMDCAVIGKWRIIEADLWDCDFFTWQGFDEMDEVSGDGSAELEDDGTLEIEIRFRLGDEAILKAKKITFSAAC